MADSEIDDVSHLLSQKMLQGWALLDKVCEVGCQGDTPLLRDPRTKQVRSFLLVVYSRSAH